LEQELLDRVRQQGLPEKLVKMKEGLIDSDNLGDSDETSDNIDITTLRTILHRYAENESTEQNYKEASVKP